MCHTLHQAIPINPRPVSEAMDGGETSAEATGQSDNHVSSSEGTTSEKWPQGVPKVRCWQCVLEESLVWMCSKLV